MGISLRPTVFNWLIISASEVRTTPPRAASFSRFWRSDIRRFRAPSLRFRPPRTGPPFGRAGKSETSTGVEAEPIPTWRRYRQAARARGPIASRHDQFADPQRSTLKAHGGHRSPAAIEPRFDRALRLASGSAVRSTIRPAARSPQQFVEVGVFGRGNLDRQRIAAKDSTWTSCCRAPAKPGPDWRRLIDLIDRDDDRRLGRLGVADRLDRLRHDAVVTATTRTTISSLCARARIAVKAACRACR